MTTSAALADTRRMTTATTRIKRSGPAIRAVLAEVSPDECAQFEVEFAQALARAGAEYDLAPAEAVLDRWWGIAVIRANPLGAGAGAARARPRRRVQRAVGVRRGRKLDAAVADGAVGTGRRWPVTAWCGWRSRGSTWRACRSRCASRSARGSSSCWRTRASPATGTTSSPTSGPPPTVAGPGMIVYAVVHERERVIILRLV